MEFFFFWIKMQRLEPHIQEVLNSIGDFGKLLEQLEYSLKKEERAKEDVAYGYPEKAERSEGGKGRGGFGRWLSLKTER
jgi:hypothetical protein